MIEMVIKSGHTSTLEHASISVEFLTNRGVLAEITRHRLASFSVESTRYCNYSSDRKGMKICRPVWLDRKIADYLCKNNGKVPETCSQTLGEIIKLWYDTLATIEINYNSLTSLSVKPQFARGILPNDLAVSMVMTTNIREWRQILSLRHDAQHAHPDIVHLMNLLLLELNKRHPVLFPLEDFPKGDYSFRLEDFK